MWEVHVALGARKRVSCKSNIPEMLLRPPASSFQCGPQHPKGVAELPLGNWPWNEWIGTLKGVDILLYVEVLP